MNDDITEPRAEHWLLPAIVVSILVALPFFFPSDVFPRALHLVAAPLTVGLLVGLVIADPGRIDRPSHLIRRMSIAVTGLLLIISITATVMLVVELIDGAPSLDSASTLLTSGVLVWIDANLTFSVLYWQLDGGGPADRYLQPRVYPDLAFAEDLSPELTRPGWRPTMVDYLYLGFTNATAFSPTDVMPMRPWAKMTMALQATISIVILTLIIANAVNILP